MQKKLWNKDFILMLQGNIASGIGDFLYSVAIGYWVYEKTGSNSLMGIMSSISMFVVMFLSPFSGSIVDKCNRKWIIVGMDVLRGIIMLAVAVLAYTNSLQVFVVLIAAFLAALCSVLFNPAVSTLMIDIIPRDEMVRGQSIHSGTLSLVNLAGKAFSGILVTVLGVPFIIMLNGISYLISAFTELFIHVPKTIGQGETVTIGGILGSAKDAIQVIMHNHFLLLYVTCSFSINLLGAGPLSLLLPFVLEKGFSVDMYGYLTAVQMAGSLVCVSMLGIVKIKPVNRFRLMVIGFPIALVLCTMMYLTDSFILMCIFFFNGVILNTAANSILYASLVLAVPLENRGAILGFINSTCTGGCAVSAVIFGILGDLFPLYRIFAAGCILSIVPALYMCCHKSTRMFISEN